MSVFLPANILLPNVDSMKSTDLKKSTDFLEKWAVIACDQFTSQPEYWAEVYKTVGDAPSSLRLVLPEAELTGDDGDRAATIAKTMERYLNEGLFKAYPDSYIYVERTLVNGSIRRGIVGAVDLDAYDYHNGSISPVRATERTVEERIPPRKKIRQDAPLELPHILLLCDDPERTLIESVSAVKEGLPKLYEFDLMAGGGHLAGWLLAGDAAVDFSRKLAAYEERLQTRCTAEGLSPLIYAVGDGNHSLATAKACYEDLKKAHPDSDLTNHPARYALLELENLHDETQQFEPIHRIIKDTDPDALLAALVSAAGAEEGYPVTWYAGDKRGTIHLDPAKGELAIGILQAFLDGYLPEHGGAIDYIHGDDVLQRLSEAPNSIGFLLHPIQKDRLFRSIAHDGVLPRKTFSMGHACEKRYYLEARKIV